MKNCPSWTRSRGSVTRLHLAFIVKMKKRGLLRTQLGASRAKVERLDREKDKVVFDLSDFEIHSELIEHAIFLEFRLKILKWVRDNDDL